MALAVYSGARIPHVAGDPLYNLVLLLLNGQDGLLTDSSLYARALSLTGTVAINSAKTLNSLPTYEKPYGAGASENQLELVAGNGFVAGLAASEFCLEAYVNPTTNGSGDDRLFSLGALYMSLTSSGQITGGSTDIGSSSISVGSSVGAAPLNSWRHVAIIRDNTTNATKGFLRLFIEGALIDTSPDFNKTDVLGGGSFSWPMGSSSNSPGYSSGGLRLTGGTRRYLTNAQGEPVNSFTPDSYPFWAPP